MGSMPLMVPNSSFPSGTGLVLDPFVRGPARGLCVGQTADAERGDKHHDDDQFLSHLVNSSRD